MTIHCHHKNHQQQIQLKIFFNCIQRVMTVYILCELPLFFIAVSPGHAAAPPADLRPVSQSPADSRRSSSSLDPSLGCRSRADWGRSRSEPADWACGAPESRPTECWPENSPEPSGETAEPRRRTAAGTNLQTLMEDKQLYTCKYGYFTHLHLLYSLIIHDLLLFKITNNLIITSSNKLWW